tara:strand:- start:1010 stop:1210 length:201 start_codon:yes stop_codon:yes gene_type:complete
MFIQDFIFIKNISYIVQKYILNSYAKVFLSNKKYILNILKKHRLGINKQNRIKKELIILSILGQKS